ncbi:MAG: hypothetical protein ABI112_14070 [Terracoccus sp.]
MARVLAVGHLLVSAAAFVVVVAWWRTGMRPDAELEGLFALFAVAIAVPATGFAFAALHCARLVFRRQPIRSRWSLLLGSVETALGAGFAVAVARSVADHHATSVALGQLTTPLDDIVDAAAQPLVLPAVLLLILGSTTLWVSIRRARSSPS